MFRIAPAFNMKHILLIKFLVKTNYQLAEEVGGQVVSGTDCSVNGSSSNLTLDT